MKVPVLSVQSDDPFWIRFRAVGWEWHMVYPGSESTLCGVRCEPQAAEALRLLRQGDQPCPPCVREVYAREQALNELMQTPPKGAS